MNDGYIGSGKWPLSIKDKTTLTREILEYADTVEQIIELEGQYLMEHFGRPGCMNATNSSIGWQSGGLNPMKDPTVVSKISGEYHWTKTDPLASQKLSDAANILVKKGSHPFLGDNNPNKDGQNAKAAMASGKHVNLTNNPSIRRSKEGIHQWQHGNAPNVGGKLNKKLIEEGRHNFLGPKLNNKRIAEGTHNFLGSDSNQLRLAAGTHPSQMKKSCEYCADIISVGMYKRWHGDNCDQNPKSARYKPK